MKIYHAVAVVTLVAPVLAEASPPMPRMPPQVAHGVLPPGPVMGTTVNPGGGIVPSPGPAPGTVINPGGGGIVPGPTPGTVINPGGGGVVPGPTPGTVINPGAGGRPAGGPPHGDHHSSAPATEPESGSH